MDNPDFIIIGAGSSGCVMAERLSASGRHKVLVLEAGGDDRRFFVQMPLGYGKTFFDPKVNWMYRAEPDPGLAGNVDHWPRAHRTRRPARPPARSPRSATRGEAKGDRGA